MLSSSIPHYIYQRNHVWWFRKRFVAQGSVVEYRLSLKTSNLNHARLCALRLQTLCLQLVSSHGGPKKCKSDSMDKTAQDQIRAKLRAKIAEWTAEETEKWYSGGQRSEGEYNSYIDIIDMLSSDLRERIALNDRPHLAQAEADSILNELPQLKKSLTGCDIQKIAREVAQAKLKSLQDTRKIISGPGIDWLTASSSEPVEIDKDEPNEPPTLSTLIEKYCTDAEPKKHSKKTLGQYARCYALMESFFGDVQVHTISGSLGREIYEILPKLPNGLTAKEMTASSLKSILDNSSSKAIGPVTASGVHTKIVRFFDWLVDQKYLKSNPIPRQEIPRPKRNHKDDRRLSRMLKPSWFSPNPCFHIMKVLKRSWFNIHIISFYH